MIAVLGVAALACAAPGLFAVVAGIRGRDPKSAFGGLPFLLAAAGFGWAMSLVVSVNHEITGSRVDPARAVGCTAEILGAGDESARVNGAHLYRFRVRVQIPGETPYETDSSGAVSPLLAGRIGAGGAGYACLADRGDRRQVEILWDRPLH
ncbi:hypothetical protein ACFHW2_27650 [Actinomadura sp. LOL_016]|uniref:hypothetical protein n=1 Tax=unclassified Actinomadura TaxID=2626254 RepID=UPI003A810D87